MEEKAEYKTEKFDQWAIVELMGHQVIAGRASEQVIAGSPLLRVDVPAVGAEPSFTKFYGGGAIYALTPVSEEVARIALEHFQPKAITVYVPMLRQLAESNEEKDDEDPDGESDWNDGDDPGF